MKGAIVLAALLIAASANAKNIKTEALVLSEIPSTTTYDWSVSGGSSTSCYGYSCQSNWSDPQGGQAQVQGATVRLQLPDERIVIVRCSMMYDVGANLLNVMSHTPASIVYRSCRIPRAGNTIRVMFRGNNATLYMQALSLDGHGHKSHETYKIVGILQPETASARP